MDTRELRYFVAVAEELHFGRAARRLGIAQPPLSRTISGLERRLGVTLLNRTSRRVTLTEAGALLLTEARPLLAALATTERKVRDAGTGPDRITLVAKAGAAGSVLAGLLEAAPAGIEVVLCDAPQHVQLLREGRADVAVLHTPFDATDGFDLEELAVESQVAILPAGHPLTARPGVRLSDVAALPGLPTARWPGADGAYPPGPGPEVRNLTQLFQLIALGRASVVVPASSGDNLRPDLAAVPVIDAAPVTTVLAWPATSRSRAVANLVQIATRVCAPAFATNA